MTAYPSVAATAAGQSIGRLCDAVPLRTNGVPWPRLVVGILFWPIVVPFALHGRSAVVFLHEAARQTLCPDESQPGSEADDRRANYAHANLTDIKQVIIRELPGQAFYKAADLIGTGADGKTIIRLEGVQRPAVFRQRFSKPATRNRRSKSRSRRFSPARSDRRTPPTRDFASP